MRSIVLGTMIATGTSLVALSPASAAPIVRDGIAVQSMIEQAQYEPRHCRRLRRACQNSLDEVKCRRYRRECGGRIY
jgi:hypothetical protein